MARGSPEVPAIPMPCMGPADLASRDSSPENEQREKQESDEKRREQGPFP